MAAISTVLALVGLSGLTVGTTSAFWFSVIFGVPFTAWAIWCWGWSFRLQADDRGIRVHGALPWIYRWSWSEIQGLEVVTLAAPIPLYRAAVLRIVSRRRHQRVAQVSHLDNASGRARMEALVQELEQIRQQRP